MVASGEIYIDIMFNRATADTTLTAMNVGTTTTQGTYPVKQDGLLLQIAILITPQAATSLAQFGFILLTCTAWSPINTQTIPFVGFGLQTVPQAELNPPEYYNVNLPVKTSVAIQGQDIFLYSPVTPNLYVFGIFQAA